MTDFAKRIEDERMAKVMGSDFCVELGKKAESLGYVLDKCWKDTSWEHDLYRVSLYPENKNTSLYVRVNTMEGKPFVTVDSYDRSHNLDTESKSNAFIADMQNTIAMIKLLKSTDWSECPVLNEDVLELPEIKEIEFGAFEGCTYSEINLPSTLETIGFDSFKNCKEIKSVYIPDSVTTIKNGAFEGCTWLEEISISAKSFKACFGYNAGMPDKAIFERVFDGCPKLNKVIIRGTRDDIYSYVFANITCRTLNYFKETNLEFVDADSNTVTYDEYKEYKNHKDDMARRHNCTDEPLKVLQWYLDGYTVEYKKAFCSDRSIVEEGHLFNWNIFHNGANPNYGNEYYRKGSSGDNILPEDEKARVSVMIDIMEYYLNGGDIEINGKRHNPEYDLYWDFKHHSASDYKKC